jgi:hypothetical protein
MTNTNGERYVSFKVVVGGAVAIVIGLLVFMFADIPARLAAQEQKNAVQDLQIEMLTRQLESANSKLDLLLNRPQ